ncbi:phenylacetate--CoA ligase family protein [Gordonia crocea]|uniref:Phenylacetate--CoA ligase n=1 Tax=Gordonia crocea TaxID=589162 RepID=A0A7M4BQ03_9ACTN|nr:hypothetical protein [Gordonia crocea]GED95964.1 phenylacetate--CoA ligase [Gordonia crocea]
MKPGLERAVDIANRALRHVPAYRDFTGGRGPVTAAGFGSLPPTGKVDYLQRYRVADLVWHGDPSTAGTWSATSGSTGAPTYFPRDALAGADAASAYDRIFRAFGAHHRSTLVVVCFAMGSWIGGTYTYLAALELKRRGLRISVATPGIDADAAVDVLTTLGPHYDQVVLTGYPPFVKDVLDQAAPEALAQQIRILLAGEAITEPWRDHLLRRIGAPGQTDRICLIYGTAEAGVMGHETPLTTDIRRAAVADPALDRLLFGEAGSRTSTFVEFDPQARFTESVDGFLLFTCDSSAMPLIRYRINDVGTVVDGPALRDLLHETGHHGLAAQVPPSGGFLTLAGRPDVAETFYSLNIYPADLRETFDDPRFADDVTGKFVVEARHDDQHDQQLTITAELSTAAGLGDAIVHALTTACTEALSRNNREYRALRASIGDRATPRVRLCPRGSGPFAPATKHRYTGRS